MNRIPERNRPLVILAVGRRRAAPRCRRRPARRPARPVADADDIVAALGDRLAVRRSVHAGGRGPGLLRGAQGGHGGPTTRLSFGRTSRESSPRPTSRCRASCSGRRESSKASVLTVQQVENISVETTGDSATVHLVYTEGGYDISLDTGEPLESPNVLAPRDVTMELRKVDGRWLVESYEAQAQ